MLLKRSKENVKAGGATVSDREVLADLFEERAQEIWGCFKRSLFHPTRLSCGHLFTLDHRSPCVSYSSWTTPEADLFINKCVGWLGVYIQRAWKGKRRPDPVMNSASHLQIFSKRHLMLVLIASCLSESAQWASYIHRLRSGICLSPALPRRKVGVGWNSLHLSAWKQTSVR